MARHQFRDTTFKAETRRRIDQAEEILLDYPGQRLTARQVYYQYVSRGWLENKVENYKKLTGWLTDARYAGIIDWEAIEDRGREPVVWSQYDSPEALIEEALRSYRLPRWRGQEKYVELWVEKQALAGVLQPLAAKFHVTLMVNKGYSSSSAMYESAQRFMQQCNQAESEFYDSDLDERSPILLYLGDHDPSGEDMVRDIEDRLTEFGVEELDVRKIALTMPQIRQFNPPPNPAKITDSRAKAYIEKYGDQSWELDALPPRELTRLIESTLEKIVDLDKMNAIIKQEKKDKERLREAARRLREE